MATITKCKVRLHEGSRQMKLNNLRVYIASQNGLPVAETIAATKAEAKAALAEELAEKFAPRYEHGGIETRGFKVVWC